MSLNAFTVGAVGAGAYRAAMGSTASLELKTQTIQLFLQGVGHRLPRYGIDGGWGHETADALVSHLGLTIKPPPVPKIGLLPHHFELTARSLDVSVAQLRAVDEVESGGGWFVDVRANILDLDGPGGFLDGPELPKILFEAHHFGRLTKNRYDGTHPNLSSPRWNRRLYVGGEGEWARLHRAMQLDREAALKSASVGRYQIMGFNHAAAGYSNVEAFWEAMKRSELEHLLAFEAFIRNAGIVKFLRKVSGDPESCAPFALAYNGPGYATHRYHERIARAYRKFAEEK